MLLKPIVDVGGQLDYHTKEKMADEAVQMLAEVPGITYQKAYDILDCHIDVLKEAISHLNHNAGVQMKDQAVVFSLHNPGKHKY